MNTPSPLTAIVPPSTFAHQSSPGTVETCPGVQLAGQLAAAVARVDQAELTGRPPAQIAALQAHLLSRAEWITPTTAAGAMVAALALSDAVDDLVYLLPSDQEASPAALRAGRLLQRLIEGLSTVGGRTPEQMGLGHYWTDLACLAPDLTDLNRHEDGVQARAA